MTSDITRQLFVIDDLLLGRSREVSVYSGELVLCPHHRREKLGFSSKAFYLGVVGGFGRFEHPGRFQGNPFVKLNPLYKIEMPEDGNIAGAKIEEWKYRNNLLPHFFKSLYTGPAEAIATALQGAPFSGIEKLADAVERLETPYNLTLKDFFENRVRELAEAG